MKTVILGLASGTIAAAITYLASHDPVLTVAFGAILAAVAWMLIHPTFATWDDQ